jgi:hypothetical protein
VSFWIIVLGDWSDAGVPKWLFFVVLTFFTLQRWYQQTKSRTLVVVEIQEVLMNTKSIHLKPGINGIINYVFNPLRNWIDTRSVHDVGYARAILRLIPPSCPFERTISVGGRMIIKIPKLCHLNPTYDQLVGLRFKALCCLEENEVDITPYIK